MFISLLQAGLVLVLAGLEYLSGYKAGVMQHLYFNKVHYTNTLYRPGLMVWHVAILLVVSAGVYAFVSRKSTIPRLARWWYAGLTVASAAVFILPFFRAYNGYAYMLMGAQICVALEWTRTMLVYAMKKQR